MRDEAEMRERMIWHFEQAAASYGKHIGLREALESMNELACGTIIGWCMGIEEDDLAQIAWDTAAFVHRENPEQFNNFVTNFGMNQGGDAT